MGVSLEPNLLHRSSDAFIDCENNARCATLFINRINTKLNANVSESLPLIHVDDFLTRFFQLLFVNRAVEWQFDFFPQSLRFDPFGSGNFDLAQNGTYLHGNDHLHSIAFGLRKNANVLNGAGLIKCRDVLLDHLVGIRLPHFCAHLRQNPVFTDRLRASVLHVDGANDRRCRR